MSVLLVFIVLIFAASGWLAWRDPDAARAFASRVARSTRQAQRREWAAGRTVTPRVIHDRAVRAVVKEAIEMPDGTRFARTSVHVSLAGDVVADLGESVLTVVGDQIRSTVDREVRDRGWSSSGPTSVQIDGSSDVSLHDVEVELARGDMTFPVSDMSEAAGRDDTHTGGRTAPAFELPGGELEVLPSLGEISVGRDPRRTIVIDRDESKVSRRHITVTFGSGAPLLTDRSSNGTWVDGQPITGSIRLQDGAVVTLGAADGVRLVYRAEAAVGAPR